MPNDLLCAVFLPELFVVFLADFLDHVEGLADKFLLDDLEQLVLLEGLAGDVQGKIIRVHDSADERQVLRHHVLKVISDEHAAHKHLKKDTIPIIKLSESEI